MLLASSSSRFVVGVLVVVLFAGACATALYFAFRSKSPEQVAGKAFYVDLESGEIFTDSALRVPPFDRGGGRLAVRAHVFSCGDDDDPRQRFVGVYQKYSDEALADMKARNAERPAGDPLISGDGHTWVSPNSKEAEAIWVAPYERCRQQGKQGRICNP